MLARTTVLSLTLSCISSSVAALDLDVNNRDSIIATTKTLVNGIATYYNESLSDSGTPGLFPKPYWWVEAGLFFNGLVEYANLTGDTQYDSLVSEALLFQAGVNYTYPFRPNSEYEVYNDHQCAWAQTAMTAAEVGFRKPDNGSWVGLSIDMFDVIANRWDVGLCDGGLTTAAYTFADRFYADMAANSNFFLLASRLARFTKNQTYSEWAEKVFDWSKDAGLLSENYVVFDGGRGKDNCTTIDHDAWTYMHGLFTEGTAVMYQNTGGKQKWADAVKGFVNSTTIFLEDGALAEIACEHNELCRSVERGFKGVAARSYARAAIAAPAVTEPLHKILETSAKAAARTCIQVGERNEETEDVRCASSWAGGFNESDAATARDGNLGEVFSAMETIQSLLYSSAKPSEPNVTDDSTDKNSTENGGAGTPEKAGGARTRAAGITAVLAVAFTAALMC